MLKVPRILTSIDELKQNFGSRLVVRIKRLISTYLRQNMPISLDRVLRCTSVAFMFCSEAVSGNVEFTMQFDDMVNGRTAERLYFMDTPFVLDKEHAAEKSFMWDAAVLMIDEFEDVESDSFFEAMRHRSHAFDLEVYEDVPAQMEALRTQIYNELIVTAKTHSPELVEQLSHLIAMNDMKVNNPERYAFLFNVPLADTDKTIAMECEPMFYNKKEEALKFVRKARLLSQKGIAVEVAKWYDENKISKLSLRHDLWKCLTNHKMYTRTEANWDAMLKKHSRRLKEEENGKDKT